MLLSCGLGYRRISAFQSFIRLWHLIKVKGSSIGQCPLHSPPHTLLSWTIQPILLACLTSKPLFFNQSFIISIHLFHGLPKHFLKYITTLCHRSLNRTATSSLALSDLRNTTSNDTIYSTPWYFSIFFQFCLHLGKQFKLSLSKDIYYLFPLCSPICSSYIPYNT